MTFKSGDNILVDSVFGANTIPFIHEIAGTRIQSENRRAH